MLILSIHSKMKNSVRIVSPWLNYLYKIPIVVLFCISCQSEQTHSNVPPNKKIIGLWQYDDAVNSYIEIDGINYTEYLGEIKATIVCSMEWEDSMNYILLVKNATGAMNKSLKPGERIKVHIAELTQTRFSFRVQNRDIIPLEELTRKK
jgi:hypothetical protein